MGKLGNKWPQRREIFLYALAVLLTSVILWFYLGLGQMDFRYPIAMTDVEDGIYYGAIVKILLETGWVYHHPDLSAPFGLELYDFVHFDALHLLIMKLIAHIVDDWAIVLNIYYLLTYFFTTITAVFFFRSMRIHPVASIILALLFTFQPYHCWRGQRHIMLAGYYLLPLQMLATIWLLSPQGLRDGENVSLLKSWRFRVACLISFVAVFAGHYYTAFALIAYTVAAIYNSLRLRTWTCLCEVAILCVVVGVGFTLNLLPNALYWAREGNNRVVSAKDPVHVEVHSLRLVPMLLPVDNHRVRWMRDLTVLYNQKTPLQYNGQKSIGLVASAGFLGLLLMGLFAVNRDNQLAGLGVVTLGLVLFCTLSGFGTLFAYLISPQMHGLSRVSILLALLGLTAVGIALTAAIERMSRPWIAIGLIVLMGVFGLFDIWPNTKIFDPKIMSSQLLASRSFGEAIQQAVPSGTIIHQMPAMSLPFSGYDQFKPYLYTKGMRWTCPAMLNRRGMAWCEEIERLKPEAMIERLAICGVDGLILEADKKHLGVSAMREWLASKGLPQITSDNGNKFYDLRSLTQSIREKLPEAELRKRHLAMFAPITFRWDDNFVQAWDRTVRPRWFCNSRKATIEIVNHLDKPTQFRLQFDLYSSEPKRRFTFKCSGLPTTTEVVAGPIQLEFTVPPGRTPIMVTTDNTTLPSSDVFPYQLVGMECSLIQDSVIVER
ncbi:MAG: hypothetical protein EBV06_05515 [Planctomycetia bacterium]|nr:hypothetical protein [Planctomycetia bacterium]